MQYLGDKTPGATLTFWFTTADSDGAPAALTSGAVAVYKDNSDTQDTDGVTLSASADSITGANRVVIDTSADGSFYSAGSDFSVIITAGTVDSTAVVGYVVGRFTLRESAAYDAVASLNDLSAAEVNAQVDAALADYDPPTHAELVSEINAVQSDIAGLNDLDAAGVRSAVGLASANLDTQLGTIDSNVDAIKAVTDNLPDSGALTSIAQASALATVDSNVDAIKAKTDGLTFTEAGAVDANVQYVNDTEVAGDGQPGTEWGPAP